MDKAAEELLTGVKSGGGLADIVFQLMKCVGTTMSQWIAFQPAPEIFGGVELRRVGGKVFHMQTRMGRDEFSHPEASASSPPSRYACIQRVTVRRSARTRRAVSITEAPSSTTKRTARIRHCSNCFALPCVLIKAY